MCQALMVKLLEWSMVKCRLVPGLGTAQLQMASFDSICKHGGTLLGVDDKTVGVVDAKLQTNKSVRCMIEAGCDVGNLTGEGLNWAVGYFVSLVVDECTTFCDSSVVTCLC
jgi:hypothetical protein